MINIVVKGCTVDTRVSRQHVRVPGNCFARIRRGNVERFCSKERKVWQPSEQRQQRRQFWQKQRRLPSEPVVRRWCRRRNQKGKAGQTRLQSSRWRVRHVLPDLSLSQSVKCGRCYQEDVAQNFPQSFCCRNGQVGERMRHLGRLEAEQPDEVADQCPSEDRGQFFRNSGQLHWTFQGEGNWANCCRDWLTEKAWLRMTFYLGETVIQRWNVWRKKWKTEEKIYFLRKLLFIFCVNLMNAE